MICFCLGKSFFQNFYEYFGSEQTISLSPGVQVVFFADTPFHFMNPDFSPFRVKKFTGKAMQCERSWTRAVSMRKTFMLGTVLLPPLFQSVVAISATNYNTVSVDHCDTRTRPP